MTMLLPTETVRRFDGTGHEFGLGQARVHGGGAATKTTKPNNKKELALPAEAGGAVGACGRWSDEPMPRADHKAKRHGRPVRARYRRKKPSRWALLEADL
jgi:hypothetical protein